jgi:hypothetical protein
MNTKTNSLTLHRVRYEVASKPGAPFRSGRKVWGWEARDSSGKRVLGGVYLFRPKFTTKAALVAEISARALLAKEGR